MWLKALQHWTWKDVRRQLLGPHGSWLPITADGIELINLSRTPAAVQVGRLTSGGVRCNLLATLGQFVPYVEKFFNTAITGKVPP
jgi:hypothetical protein